MTKAENIFKNMTPRVRNMVNEVAARVASRIRRNANAAAERYAKRYAFDIASSTEHTEEEVYSAIMNKASEILAR